MRKPQLEAKLVLCFAGIGWLGGRGLHTTRSIAQIFLGAVFNVSSHLYDFWMPVPEVHDKTTEINKNQVGSQFNSFYLNMYDCVKPSMAEWMWEDQQSGYLKLNRISACKTFFIVELLHWARELYRRIAARKVELPGLQATLSHNAAWKNGVFNSNNPFQHCQKHVCMGLFISLPCRKKGVAYIWLAYMPAEIV
jgi:hypothetical protein